MKILLILGLVVLLIIGLALLSDHQGFSLNLSKFFFLVLIFTFCIYLKDLVKKNE